MSPFLQNSKDNLPKKKKRKKRFDGGNEEREFPLTQNLRCWSMREIILMLLGEKLSNAKEGTREIFREWLVRLLSSFHQSKSLRDKYDSTRAIFPQYWILTV